MTNTRLILARISCEKKLQKAQREAQYCEPIPNFKNSIIGSSEQLCNDLIRKNLSHFFKKDYTLSTPLPSDFNAREEEYEYWKAVMNDILTYLELPHACSFRIVYQDDSDYAGTYSNQILKNQITLSICTKQNPMSILAALCHECTHFFMHYHGLNVSNTQVNEKRTDACAVIIGFAYILYQGYQTYANRRIGYLLPETCLEIHKFALYKSKCVDNHNKLCKNIAVAKTLYDQAESLYNTIDISQIKKYTFCVVKAITYFEKADFTQIISSCEKVDASNVNQLINANERINNISADMADCIYLFQNLYNGKVCKKRQHNAPRTKHTCANAEKRNENTKSKQKKSTAEKIKQQMKQIQLAKYTQAKNEKLGMAWFSFIINFKLFAGILGYILAFILTLYLAIDIDGFNENALILIAELCIFLSVITLYVRHSLSRFYRHSLKLYFATMYTMPIIYNVLIALITEDASSLSTASALLICGILEGIYFYKRSHLFNVKAIWHDTKTIPIIDDNVFEQEQQSKPKKHCTGNNSRRARSAPKKRATIKPKQLVVSTLIIALISVFIGACIISYNKGFSDNQPIASNDTPIVYITPSGAKYHKKNCTYLKSSVISISVMQAEERGYRPCSRCKPYFD